MLLCVFEDIKVQRFEMRRKKSRRRMTTKNKKSIQIFKSHTQQVTQRKAILQGKNEFIYE